MLKLFLITLIARYSSPTHFLVFLLSSSSMIFPCFTICWSAVPLPPSSCCSLHIPPFPEFHHALFFGTGCACVWGLWSREISCCSFCLCGLLALWGSMQISGTKFSVKECVVNRWMMGSGLSLKASVCVCVRFRWRLGLSDMVAVSVEYWWLWCSNRENLKRIERKWLIRERINWWVALYI